MLPHGGLPEVIPSYLKKLIEQTGGANGPLGRQFVAQPELEAEGFQGVATDSLIEDEHEISGAPGLVYKYKEHTLDGQTYPGRALWTVTRKCAAYCRFCTRGREVGIPDNMQGTSSGTLSHTPALSDLEIAKTLDYIAKEPGLNEIILSGGDPLTLKPAKLNYILKGLGELQKTGKLDIVRIGTRLPIHNPIAVRKEHFEAISNLQNPYMMIHINHPAELTHQALEVLHKLKRECNASVLSQTVLLAGVNDNVETLAALFNKMAKEGIRPYYVFQCDPVYWARHLTVPVGKAIDLWQNLRPLLSGVAATARFVIDTPGGYGKVSVPEGGSWNVDYLSGYKDFEGIHRELD